MADEKIVPLYNMDISPVLITAIDAFDDAIVAAIENVLDAGVHKGFVVGMLHAYAHRQTREMVDRGYA